MPSTSSLLQKDTPSEPAWGAEASKSPRASWISSGNSGSREGVWLWACILWPLGATVLAQLRPSAVMPRGTRRREATKKDFGQRRRPGWRQRQGRVSTIFFWHLSAFSVSHILIWSSCPSPSQPASEAANRELSGVPSAPGTGSTVDQADLVPKLVESPDQQERQILNKVL